MSVAEFTVCCILRCGGKNRTNHKAIHDFPLLEVLVLPTLALFKCLIICTQDKKLKLWDLTLSNVLVNDTVLSHKPLSNLSK